MESSNLLWIPFSLLAGILTAGITLTNQYAQVSGFSLNILSRLITFIVILPLAFFIEWPSSPIYYIAVITTGFFSGFGDIRSYNTVAKLGGGIVSRLMPLLVPVSFIGWFIASPSDIIIYLEKPLVFLGIITAITAIVLFVMQLHKKCEISKEAIWLMMPVVFLYGMNGVLAKIAMNHAELYQGVYFYIFIQTISLLISVSSFSLWQNRKKTINDIYKSIKISRKLIITSILISIFIILHMIFKISSFAFIDNPAYPNALVLLSPLWVILFYKIIRHKEEANVSAGIGILISAIVLVFLTAR